LDEEVYMVFVGSNLHKVDFPPQRNAQTGGVQSLGDTFGQHIPTVFHWTDYVVKEKGFVVTFLYVIAHPVMIPRSKLTGKDLILFLQVSRLLAGYYLFLYLYSV